MTRSWPRFIYVSKAFFADIDAKKSRMGDTSKYVGLCGYLLSLNVTLERSHCAKNGKHLFSQLGAVVSRACSARFFSPLEVGKRPDPHPGLRSFCDARSNISTKDFHSMSNTRPQSSANDPAATGGTESHRIGCDYT